MLGTEFAVRTTDREAAVTHVAVRSGRVRVQASLGTSGEAELSPGEVAVIDGTGRVSPLGADDFAAAFSWLEGELGFVRTPLADVVDRIRRQTGATIRIGAEVDGNLTVTGTFVGEDAEAVARALGATLGLEVREGADGFELVTAGRP